MSKRQKLQEMLVEFMGNEAAAEELLGYVDTQSEENRTHNRVLRENTGSLLDEAEAEAETESATQSATQTESESATESETEAEDAEVEEVGEEDVQDEEEIEIVLTDEFVDDVAGAVEEKMNLSTLIARIAKLEEEIVTLKADDADLQPKAKRRKYVPLLEKRENGEQEDEPETEDFASKIQKRRQAQLKKIRTTRVDNRSKSKQD